MLGRRTLLYAALALCVPLPALALTADRGTSDAPAELSVSVALERCGVLEARVVCRLDVSYEAIPEATSYTAAVSRPDGSVVDLGGLGASPASVWVPYSGDGTYTVEVFAYGEADKPGEKAKLIDRDRASAAGPEGPASVGVRAARPGADEALSPEGEVGAGSGAGGEQGGKPPAPACSEEEVAEEPEQGTPSDCPELAAAGEHGGPDA